MSLTYKDIQSHLENCSDEEEAYVFLYSLDKATRAAFAVMQEFLSFVQVRVWWDGLTAEEQAKFFENIATNIVRATV